MYLCGTMFVQWLGWKRQNHLHFPGFLGCFAGFLFSKLSGQLYVTVVDQEIIKVKTKCFFIAEFERVAKIRKIAVYRFLIPLTVTEL